MINELVGQREGAGLIPLPENVQPVPVAWLSYTPKKTFEPKKFEGDKSIYAHTCTESGKPDLTKEAKEIIGGVYTHLGRMTITSKVKNTKGQIVYSPQTFEVFSRQVFRGGQEETKYYLFRPL